MKQNKKGFTLIELLAVIVILAIIALIATPIILSMINNARESAAKSSALGYVESIEYYVGFYEARQGGMTTIDSVYSKATPEGECEFKTVSDNNVWKSNKAEATAADDTLCAEFYAAVSSTTKGKAPEVGTKITVTNGKVAANSVFKFNNKTVTYTGNDAEVS